MEKLQRLTDAGFAALHGLRELRSLDVAECCLVSGRELAKVLEFPKGPPPHLTSLRLAYCSLLKVLKFPCLKRLSLSLLLELTDTGLVAVARGCPSLEHLALSHCSRLSDRGWDQAVNFWKRLQHLNLSSCNQLTEQTLVSIRKACRQLTVLDVSMCQGISVAAVRHFQAQLPHVTCVQSRFVGGADLAMSL
uniref:F-box/LRR-repeat protein 15-like leucin rich repeat domain-containing protein n=1 Tax=Vombatus ursinus TaxID=29139 RepID=A0A4X2LSC8_VOMUR